MKEAMSSEPVIGKGKSSKSQDSVPFILPKIQRYFDFLDFGCITFFTIQKKNVAVEELHR